MGSDGRLAPLDEAHPENAVLLAWLARDGHRTPIARPSSVADAFTQCGSHPDVVERVWDQLGAGLPRAARALVYGRPGLVHERRGLVLALALGTQYALRLPVGVVAEAEGAGLRSVHVYRTVGERVDVGAWGGTWRFGAWVREEAGWVVAVHAEVGGG